MLFCANEKKIRYFLPKKATDAILHRGETPFVVKQHPIFTHFSVKRNAQNLLCVIKITYGSKKSNRKNNPENRASQKRPKKDFRALLHIEENYIGKLCITQYAQPECFYTKLLKKQKKVYADTDFRV